MDSCEAVVEDERPELVESNEGKEQGAPVGHARLAFGHTERCRQGISWLS